MGKTSTNHDMSEALKLLKSTLRLPSSKFPPRPPPEALQRYISRCDDLYTWQLRERPAKTHATFTLHDGPPYANGDLHVGHALNKIIKDIICRSQLADGKRINYIPGWDCHGLPIELKAFEKHGWERGSAVAPVKIRGAARGFAAKAVEKQMKGFRSWGIMADWDNHWKTMDKDFELRQLTVFKAMAEHGLIVRRHKPVYWSPSSQTALAEAEIERDTHTSTAALVKFRIPAVVAGSAELVHAVIWTTTPWTLPANQAIAINKDLKYLLVRSKTHGNLVVAHSRIVYLNEQLGEETEMLKVLKAEELLECTYSGLSQFGPEALNRPIIHADFVTEDEGTGLVHCAPGHGQDDYTALQDLIKCERVKVKAPVNDKGEFTEAACPTEPSLLAGKYVFKEGNAAVIDLLRSEKALISSYDFKHKYPIDWRTKLPIMIRATAQWFADISKIKDDVVASLENIEFRPLSGKSRLKSFVENRNEWCISRQRAWGVPIPAIYHKDTNEAVLNSESIEHIIQVIKERGIDRWWSDSADDPAWITPGLQASEYVRGKDTMDVWFDSGTSWASMADLKGAAPQTKALADVYLEGSDQHRGWFQSSILTNIAFQKAANPAARAFAPFKQLVTHGFTLDGEGKKMSKSIGNVVSPDQIIAGLAPQPPKASKKGRVLHSHGPDALRLWAATGDWTSDVSVSETMVTNVHKSLDKYRVTFKVLLGMLSDFDPRTMMADPKDRHSFDRLDVMALDQLHSVASSVRQCMNSYEFHKALAYINEWLARDVSSFYLETVKDKIYCDSPTSSRRRHAQSVLYQIFTQFQHMLGAITPLLVEEAHEHTPDTIREYSGHPLQRVWELPPTQRQNLWAKYESDVAVVKQINTVVKALQERARADKKLGQSLACNVHIYGTKLADKLWLTENDWKDLLVVSKCSLVESDAFRVVGSYWESAVAITGFEERVKQDSGVEWVYSQHVQVDGVQENDVYVVITSPTNEKCARCWTYNAQKTEKKDEPSLCQRCEDAVAEIKDAANCK